MYIKEEFAVWFVCGMLCMLVSVWQNTWSCYSCRKLFITYSITQPSFLYFTLLSMGFYTSDYMVWSINLSRAFSTSVSLSNLRSKANCRIVFLCILLEWQFESHLVKYHSWNRTIFIRHDKSNPNRY